MASEGALHCASHAGPLYIHAARAVGLATESCLIFVCRARAGQCSVRFEAPALRCAGLGDDPEGPGSCNDSRDSSADHDDCGSEGSSASILDEVPWFQDLETPVHRQCSFCLGSSQDPRAEPS